MHDEPTHPWIEEVVAPETGETTHIDNIQIASLMYGAWMRYMTHCVGVTPDDFRRVGRPTVREISARFDAEVFPGEALTCGVRTLSRRRRSFTLGETLWRADGTRVASGTTVLVTVDPTTYAPVEIPTKLWAAIEGAEGRSIPQE